MKKMEISTDTFTLTKDGKLPKNCSMMCPINGIYAFLIDNEVVRFGESGSGFNRIRKGFNHQLYKSNNKKNYIAYHFREKLKSKKLEIRYYSIKRESLSKPESRRAIEAELAYQYRYRTGAWPKFMIEIHFFNKMNKTQNKFVSDVLTNLCI